MAFVSSLRRCVGKSLADPFLRHTLNPELIDSLNRNVQVVSFESMGLGLAASCDIAIGEEVMRIPAACWGLLSAQRAETTMPADFKLLVNEFAESHPSNGSLESFYSSFMLKQTLYLSLHLLREIEHGDMKAKAYMKLIASSNLDVPLFWPQQDLDLLRGSHTFDEIMERRTFIGWLYRSVVSPARERYHNDPLFSTASPSNFAWAMSIILSRAVSGFGNQYALPPVLDFLNHSPVYMDTFQVPPGLCSVSFDPEIVGDSITSRHINKMRKGFPGEKEFNSSKLLREATASSENQVDEIQVEQQGSFSVKSLCCIEKGSQVFISYGDLGNATLLRMYGFTLDGNPHDKAKVVMNGKSYWVSHHDPLPRVMLRDALDSMSSPTEIGANKIVYRAIENQLKSTVLLNDEQFGAAVAQGGIHVDRYQKCDMTLKGELRVLQNAFESVRLNMEKVAQIATG